MSLRAMFEEAADFVGLAERSRETYWSWTGTFFRAVKKPAREWRGADWEFFERWLMAQRPAYSVAARKQARSAVNFIFRHVLKLEVGRLELPHLPKPEPALVVVPTREELVRLFAGLRGQDWLACRIMHGSGTRVEETCRIRVQDVDIEKARLRVWDGKGEKNRVTVLPVNLLPALKRQIDWRKAVHERDVAEGNGFVELPGRVGRKWRGAARALGWQWLLASGDVVKQHRWYHSPGCVQRALKCAREAAGIVKRIVPHSLRKVFASELQQAGMPAREIQGLLGHADLNTTATHYLEANAEGAFSPADVPAAALQRPWAIERKEALRLR
jgi:integrase